MRLNDVQYITSSCERHFTAACVLPYYYMVCMKTQAAAHLATITAHARCGKLDAGRQMPAFRMNGAFGVNLGIVFMALEFLQRYLTELRLFMYVCENNNYESKAVFIVSVGIGRYSILF